MTLFERVCEHLSQQNYEPPVVSAIITLNGALKTFGPQAESLYKEQVDKLQVQTMSICFGTWVKDGLFYLIYEAGLVLDFLQCW